MRRRAVVRFVVERNADGVKNRTVKRNGKSDDTTEIAMQEQMLCVS